MQSAHDGQPLPHWWLCSPYKSGIVHRLMIGKRLSAMPSWWREQAYDQRMRVIHHLVASGELLDGHYVNLTGHHYTPGPYKVFDNQRWLRGGWNRPPQAESSITRAFPAGTVTGRRVSSDSSGMEARVADHAVDALRMAPKKPKPFLEGSWYMHDTPNGGKRILPSVYTKLTTHWLQRSGEYIEPRCMNEHHLKCTIALLHESHGNFVAKACLLAGKMHAHLECDPDTRADLEKACLQMQKLDISKMYPIFDLLAKEYELKLKTPPAPVYMLDIETHGYGPMEWDDK